MVTFEEIMKCADSNHDNFEELVKLCAGDLVVPYIGAGFSRFAGFPLWKGCLEKFISEYCNDKTISTENLYDAADAIMEDLQSDKFNEIFHDTFGGNKDNKWWEDTVIKKSAVRDEEDIQKKEQAVFYIPELFNGPIITTNFDQILEKIHNSTLPVAFPNNIEEITNAIKHRKHLIYKIHGCVSKPNDIVFTGESYKKSYRSDSELVQKLSDFFKGVNFLFLGCGLDLSESGKDKPIELWEKLTNTGMYHFAILEETDNLEDRQKELKEKNIKPIFFPKGKYDTIKTILFEIVKRKKSAFGKIPEYKSDFVGRKKILEEIEQHLENSNYSAFALTGTGGVGKTRIMREYAYEKQKTQAYKEIVWFNAVSKDSVQAGIYQFAEKEKLIESIDEKQKEIFKKVKDWMVKNDNWLFLLDNVEDYKDIEELLSIESDITTKGKRHFLITTRKSNLLLNHKTVESPKSTFWRFLTDNWRSYFLKNTQNRCFGGDSTVDIFDEKEAQDFLHSYTKLNPDDFSKEITNKLGHLPLALEQAAAYIKWLSTVF